MLPPSQKFPFGNGLATGTLMTGAGIITGWSLTEQTGAAAATVRIFDGTQDVEQQLAVVTLSSGQSTRDLWAPNGIEIRNGLYVVVTAGDAFGTIFALPGEIADGFVVVAGFRPVWSGAE